MILAEILISDNLNWVSLKEEITAAKGITGHYREYL
jgi:hypothetical protein